MSHDAPRRHLIAYDIADDHRRNRIAKKLEAHGDRIQYSVFVVDIRPAKLLRLRYTLESLIDKDVDSVIMCDLGTPDNAPTLNRLGRHRPLTADNPIII